MVEFSSHVNDYEYPSYAGACGLLRPANLLSRIVHRVIGISNNPMAAVRILFLFWKGGVSV